MEAFADEAVNEIACMCSAQSAKTLTILVLLAWVIAEDPGPILWVTSNLQEARKFAKTRLIPLLERCGPVANKMPTGRGDKNTLEIFFPGAPLIITGANSPASLQSTPFRYIFLDEVRSYPPGALEMVEKRTRSYPHNYKKVIISTPDEENDALHRAYLKGDQRHYHAELPCGHRQELGFKDKDEKGGIKWESNDVTKPNGQYKFEELVKTIRYECELCGERFADQADVRKHISSNGEWVARNPNAPTNCVSFHWGALLPWWTSWGMQVTEYLQSLKALDVGDYEPYKSFVTETTGNVWTDKMRYLKHAKFLSGREEEYDPTQPWSMERRRFATIDVQAKGGRHYYLTIRAWGLGAASRLLHCEVIWDFGRLMEVCAAWKVEPANIVFDVGTFQTELFQRIVDGPRLPNGDYAMKGFWGDDAESYKVGDARKLYNLVPTDPALGVQGREVNGVIQRRVPPIWVRRWAKKPAQDRLAFFMAGGGSSNWRILRDTPQDYRQQVTAWDLRDRTDRNGATKKEWWKPEHRPDHYYSCELMQIIAADNADLLSTAAPADGQLKLH